MKSLSDDYRGRFLVGNIGVVETNDRNHYSYPIVGVSVPERIAADSLANETV